MHLPHLHAQLKKDAISIVNVIGRRQSFLIPKDVFHKHHAHHFPKKGGFLKGTGMRSKHLFKHLHAKTYGTYVEVHTDYGNVIRTPLLVPFHFFLDVLPHTIYSLYKHKRLSFTPMSVHKKP